MKRTDKISIWKIAFAVWAPIIVLGTLYGTIYTIRNLQANHAQSVYNQEAQACEDKVRQENAIALTKGDTSNGVEICSSNTYGIVHGTLWLPVFEVQGMPDNSGKYY